MVMPANPTADLVVIETGFSVACLEHFFNPVSLPLHLDQIGQRDTSPGVGQGIVNSGLADRANHDQAFLWADPAILLGPDTYCHRVNQQWSLFRRADCNPLPLRLRPIRRPLVHPLEWHFALAAASRLPAPRTTAFKVTDRRVTGHVEHVSLAALTQSGAEFSGASKLIIARDPAMLQARQATAQEIQTNLSLLLELDR